MVRPGKTLFEMMVVIVILFLCSSLILGAVQKIRNANTNIQCKFNLKQIGLALSSYHSVNNVFPSATIMTEYPSNWQYSSWRVAILPYIEREDLFRMAESCYRRWPGPFEMDEGKRHDVRAKVVPTFTCPADGRTSVPWLVFYNTPTRPEIDVALSSFLGVSGKNHALRDGVLFDNSVIGFSHILDGCSNTLAVGERPPSRDLRYGWWYAGNGVDSTGAWDSHLGTAETTPLPHFPKDNYSYWSHHGSGANFLLCDGSVRWFATHSQSLLDTMASRAGSDVPPLD